MNFYRYLSLLAVAATSFIIISCSSKEEYRSIDGFTQGTTYHIVYTSSEAREDGVAKIVDSLLAVIDNTMSVYNPNSEISAINRGEREEVSPLFENVFNRSKEIYRLSDGAFDVSAAPLFDAWGFGFKNRENVNQQMVDSIMTFVGMDKVKIDGGKLYRSDSRLTLNFNAIAQGYTSDYIASYFDKMGMKNYLIEVGGEIYCKGVNSRGEMWSVAIDKPVDGNNIPGNDLQDIVNISERGLATSGNYRKFYEVDGKKYSHTINPKSGYPVEHNLLSATVIAKDAMTADAIATYLMVVGLDRAKEVLKSMPEVDAYLVYSHEGEFKVYKTDGVIIKK